MQDFTSGPAMSEAECLKALQIGFNSVNAEDDLLVAGEMSIDNTTFEAEIALALFGGAGAD
jgi:nicotinate-nucleotide--dimethylbenzimidazole phosphoribosyltransferase